MERRFEDAWWNGSSADSYADSLENPDNTKVFQRHWIGVTPMEAELRRPRGPDGPLASVEHSRTALAKREEACYTAPNGLFHTGTGPTSAPAGNPGPSCDAEVSTVPSERSIFTLNTSIMAVAEAALGRMSGSQLATYTTANARVQLVPAVWELPGAMPEIAPGGEFGANIDKLFTERSMALQAWGTYGILWPVVHYQLGVAPDVGRKRVRIVPQIPDGQSHVSGRNIRLGVGSVAVFAARTSDRLTTLVRQTRPWRLTVGALLPEGAHISSVRLDGHPVTYRVVTTARGQEVRVNGGRARGATRLVVRLG
jgi:hypothetical protein